MLPEAVVPVKNGNGAVLPPADGQSRSLSPGRATLRLTVDQIKSRVSWLMVHFPQGTRTSPHMLQASQLVKAAIDVELAAQVDKGHPRLHSHTVVMTKAQMVSSVTKSGSPLGKMVAALVAQKKIIPKMTMADVTVEAMGLELATQRQPDARVCFITEGFPSRPELAAELTSRIGPALGCILASEQSDSKKDAFCLQQGWLKAGVDSPLQLTDSSVRLEDQVTGYVIGVLKEGLQESSAHAHAKQLALPAGVMARKEQKVAAVVSPKQAEVEKAGAVVPVKNGDGPVPADGQSCCSLSPRRATLPRSRVSWLMVHFPQGARTSPHMLQTSQLVKAAIDVELAAQAADTDEADHVDAHSSLRQYGVRKRIFDAVDANHDGRVSHAELIKALRTQPELVDLLGLGGGCMDMSGEESPSRSKIEAALFQTMDSDNSKTVSLAEFAVYVATAQNSASGKSSGPVAQKPAVAAQYSHTIVMTRAQMVSSVTKSGSPLGKIVASLVAQKTAIIPNMTMADVAVEAMGLELATQRQPDARVCFITEGFPSRPELAAELTSRIGPALGCILASEQSDSKKDAFCLQQGWLKAGVDSPLQLTDSSVRLEDQVTGYVIGVLKGQRGARARQELQTAAAPLKPGKGGQVEKGKAGGEPGAAGADDDIERLKNLERLFNAVDSNHNGTVSRAELIRALRSQAELVDLLGFGDPDEAGDGSKGGIKITQESDIRTRVEMIFQAMDGDESKSVSLDEFEYYVIHAHPTHPTQSGGPAQPANYQHHRETRDKKQQQQLTASSATRGDAVTAAAAPSAPAAAPVPAAAATPKKKFGGLGGGMAKKLGASILNAHKEGKLEAAVDKMDADMAKAEEEAAVGATAGDGEPKQAKDKESSPALVVAAPDHSDKDEQVGKDRADARLAKIEKQLLDSQGKVVGASAKKTVAAVPRASLVTKNGGKKPAAGAPLVSPAPINHTADYIKSRVSWLMIHCPKGGATSPHMLQASQLVKAAIDVELAAQVDKGHPRSHSHTIVMTRAQMVSSVTKSGSPLGKMVASLVAQKTAIIPNIMMADVAVEAIGLELAKHKRSDGHRASKISDTRVCFITEGFPSRPELAAELTSRIGPALGCILASEQSDSKKDAFCLQRGWLKAGVDSPLQLNVSGSSSSSAAKIESYILAQLASDKGSSKALKLPDANAVKDPTNVINCYGKRCVMICVHGPPGHGKSHVCSILRDLTLSRKRICATLSKAEVVKQCLNEGTPLDAALAADLRERLQVRKEKRLPPVLQMECFKACIQAGDADVILIDGHPKDSSETTALATVMGEGIVLLCVCCDNSRTVLARNPKTMRDFDVAEVVLEKEMYFEDHDEVVGSDQFYHRHDVNTAGEGLKAELMKVLDRLVPVPKQPTQKQTTAVVVTVVDTKDGEGEKTEEEEEKEEEEEDLVGEEEERSETETGSVVQEERVAEEELLLEQDNFFNSESFNRGMDEDDTRKTCSAIAAELRTLAHRIQSALAVQKRDDSKRESEFAQSRRISTLARQPNQRGLEVALASAAVTTHKNPHHLLQMMNSSVDRRR